MRGHRCCCCARRRPRRKPDARRVRILDAEFAGAIAVPGAPPPAALPQLAFSGRSNVGKSSLINRLLGRTRHGLARVSGTPGKTQEINFYRVRAENAPDEWEFLLVDLPGYGFARAPQRVRAAWGRLIETYLGQATALRGVVQLIDARHDPTADDRRMVRFLADAELPTLFVLTKADKLKRSERASRFARSREILALDADQVLPFSSLTGEGQEELLDAVEALLHPEAVT